MGESYRVEAAVCARDVDALDAAVDDHNALQQKLSREGGEVCRASYVGVQIHEPREMVLAGTRNRFHPVDTVQLQLCDAHVVRNQCAPASLILGSN